MENRINVLWIDDEHEDLLPLKVDAERRGIYLHPFKSSKEGLKALSDRIEFFDAVLLDALCFQREDQSVGTESLAGLDEARGRIQQLSNIKAFTPFILTGQEQLEKSSVFKDMVGSFYSKREQKDVQRLFVDIRHAAELMVDTQIRHRHQRVFDVCSARYIGDDAAPRLLSILKRTAVTGSGTDTDENIVAIRKIMEDVFTSGNRLGLVPPAFMPASSALNETGAFLAGRVSRGYQINADVVPKVVGELIGNILACAQPAAHRGQVDEHLKLVQSPYLLHGLTYMLMDVLLWFKGFADNPPAGPLFEKVEQSSITEPLHTGPIERDAFGNVHCGDYSIAPGRLTGFAVGDMVSIMDAAENSSARNMHLYSKFAKRFHKA